MMTMQKPQQTSVQRVPKLSVRLKINDDTYTMEPLADKPGAFRVTRPPHAERGESGPVSYVVKIHGERKVSCTCPDGGLKRNRCKHIFGVLRLMCVFAFAGVGKPCPPASKLFPPDGEEQPFTVVAPDAPASFSYVDEDTAHDEEPAGHGQ